VAMSRKRQSQANKYEAGHVVLVKKPRENPFPGRIVSIDGKKVSVQVFYRVSDFPRGVKVPLKALEHEVYATDSVAEYPLNQIIGPATVNEVGVREPQEVDPFADTGVDGEGEKGENSSFFTRYYYNVDKQTFTEVKGKSESLSQSSGDSSVTVRHSKKRKRGGDDDNIETEGKKARKKRSGQKKTQQKVSKQPVEVGTNMLIIQPNPQDEVYNPNFPFWVAQEIVRYRKRVDVTWYESKKLLGSYAPLNSESSIHEDGVIVHGFSLQKDGTLPPDIIQKISQLKPNGWENESHSSGSDELSNGLVNGSHTRTTPSSPSKKKSETPIIISPLKPAKRIQHATDLAREAIVCLQDPVDIKQAALKLKHAYFWLEPQELKSPAKTVPATPVPKQQSKPQGSPQKKVVTRQEQKAPRKRGRKPKVSPPTEEGKEASPSRQSKASPPTETKAKESSPKSAKKKRQRKPRGKSPVPKIPDETPESTDGRRRSGRSSKKSYSEEGLVQHSILQNLPIQAPKLKGTGRR